MIELLEKQIGEPVNYTVMNEEEFVFRKKNNDPFIWNFLRQPLIIIIGSEDDVLK